MTLAIQFDNVSKHFSNTFAVQQVSFDIKQGSIVALLGHNGAGKSTSLSMLLGLMRPSTGKVSVLGHSPTSGRTRKHIGAMLQEVSMPSKVSPRELLNLFRSFHDAPLPTDELLRMAGLESTKTKDVSQLSGGQQRRLQYALAMSGNPDILVLDEPTTGMDVTSRREFWHHLRLFVHQHGRTMLVSTHHLEEADSIADRILVMQHGQLIADGTPADLKAKTGYRYVSCTFGSQSTADAVRQALAEDHVEISGNHLKIRTKDADRVLRTLIQNSLDVAHFDVSGGQLEDAFVALTEPDEAETLPPTGKDG